VFWGCSAIGLLGDIIVLAYGWLLVFLVVAVDLASNPRQCWAALPKRLWREFAVPAGLFCCFLVALTANGQFSGFAGFLLDVGSMSSYSATPASIDEWLAVRSVDNGFFFWAPAILVGLGLYETLAGQKSRPRSVAILLIGLASLGLLFKQFMHQGSAYFLGLSVPFGGFLLLVFVHSKTEGLKHRALAAFTTGIVLMAFYVNGSLGSFWVRVSQPGSIWSDVKSIVRESGRSELYVERQWDLKSFRQFPQLLTVMDAIGPKLSPDNPHDLFTLTDEQMLYILARKRPPFYANVYDGSPLNRQQRTVDWLRKHRPSVVVYSLEAANVFGVPAIVRIPIVFEEIILNYSLDERVEQYVILRPRRPDEKIDLAFWASQFGDIHLGHLPGVSNVSRLGPCDGDRCAEFLHLHSTDDGSARERVVNVTVGDEAFRVRFTSKPDSRDYYIPLDRLWFWGGLRAHGLTPEVSSPVGGMEVSVLQREPMEGILY
jgi:hypothetical protein